MKKTASSPLARKLKALRLAFGLSRAELAVLAECSYTTVTGLEQGTRKGSTRTLRGLDAAFRRLASERGQKLPESLASRS